MSKHTPGPWHSSDLDGTAVWTSNHIQVADCSGVERSLERQQANARLIAAAPDLLTACRDALDSLEYVERHMPKSVGWGVRQERIILLREALAKAAPDA